MCNWWSMARTSKTYSCIGTASSSTSHSRGIIATKVLCKNEKWIQRIAETTPKRSRLSISVAEDDEVDEDANNRPEDNKIAKERNNINAFGGTYKEELVDMIETKKVLAGEHKEENTAWWNEVKLLEDEQ
ncbi:60S ribosomal protein L36a [Hordeum vulgare]|nr:60S ribosomal protein L36a [Hordeum vulgare]